MIPFTLLSILALASLTLAAPSARNLAARQAPPSCTPGTSVSVTLIGAADAQYSISVPCDNTFTPTSNPLSISHVETDAGPCLIVGSDWNFQFQEAGYTDFGPPQGVVGVVCGTPPQ